MARAIRHYSYDDNTVIELEIVNGKLEITAQDMNSSMNLQIILTAEEANELSEDLKNLANSITDGNS